MPETTKNELVKWIWDGTIFIAVVLVVVTFGLPLLYGELGDAAEFGDMFGVANALFSGLAFLGVIVAILLQRKELELQRKELRSSTLAQRDSADALNRQFSIQTLAAWGRSTSTGWASGGDTSRFPGNEPRFLWVRFCSVRFLPSSWNTHALEPPKQLSDSRCRKRPSGRVSP